MGKKTVFKNSPWLVFIRKDNYYNTLFDPNQMIKDKSRTIFSIHLKSLIILLKK